MIEPRLPSLCEAESITPDFTTKKSNDSNRNEKHVLVG